MEKITKIDSNTVEIKKEYSEIETKTYEELVSDKLNLEKQMADNAIVEQRNREYNQSLLDDLIARIDEADKLNVKEREEVAVEGVVGL